MTKQACLGKCMIKRGAVIWSDHRSWKWGVTIGQFFPDTLFNIESFFKEHDSYTLYAYGYGLLGQKDIKAYGNGSLFVKAKDIKLLSEKEAKMLSKPCKEKDTVFEDAWSVLATLREMDVYEEAGLDMIEQALIKGEESYKVLKDKV